MGFIKLIFWILAIFLIGKWMTTLVMAYAIRKKSRQLEKLARQRIIIESNNNSHFQSNTKKIFGKDEGEYVDYEIVT